MAGYLAGYHAPKRLNFAVLLKRPVTLLVSREFQAKIMSLL